MRSAMPRTSHPQSPSQAPPPTRYPRPPRRAPSTSRRRASTTMPATPLARPYRPILPSCRPLPASPPSSTKLPRLIARNTRLATIRGALGGAAVTWRRIAACSLRPKEHMAHYRQPRRRSPSLRAPIWEPHLPASILQGKACHKRQSPRRRPRLLRSRPPT